jgi:hypothetical protein
MSERQFQLARQQRLARDNHECVICKSTENLHVHHVEKTYGLGINHSEDNLRTLCRNCHYKLNAKSLLTLSSYSTELLQFYSKDDLLELIGFLQGVIGYQQDKLFAKEENEDIRQEVERYISTIDRRLNNNDTGVSFITEHALSFTRDILTRILEPHC